MNKYAEYKEIYKGLIKEAFLLGRLLGGAKQFGKNRLGDLKFLAQHGTGDKLKQDVVNKYFRFLDQAKISDKSDDIFSLLRNRLDKEVGRIDMKARKGLGTAGGLGAGLLGIGAAAGYDAAPDQKNTTGAVESYAAAPDQENVTAFEALKRGNIF